MNPHSVAVRMAFLLSVSALSVPTLGAQTLSPRRDSTRTTVTRTPFDGKDHFIGIVPMDSSNIDNMPMPTYAPHAHAAVIATDTLQFALPDSVLRDILKLDLKPLHPRHN